MSTASWNLCPEGDSAGCYYAADQAFDQLAGSTRVVVPDVPDGAGHWEAVGGSCIMWVLRSWPLCRAAHPAA